jgi:hypothetical protein
MHLKQQKDAPLWPPQASAYSSNTELESDAELKYVMFQLFLVHFFLKQHNGEQALQILNTLVPWFPESHHIATQVLAYFLFLNGFINLIIKPMSLLVDRFIPLLVT